jgi:hypothetical protein
MLFVCGSQDPFSFRMENDVCFFSAVRNVWAGIFRNYLGVAWAASFHFHPAKIFYSWSLFNTYGPSIFNFDFSFWSIILCWPFVLHVFLAFCLACFLGLLSVVLSLFPTSATGLFSLLFYLHILFNCWQLSLNNPFICFILCRYFLDDYVFHKITKYFLTLLFWFSFRSQIKTNVSF